VIAGLLATDRRFRTCIRFGSCLA